MGIFDDAIRQHLDLKRRQGADEDELQQLEDEAFGPPARPGDPDFPETGESAAEGGAETGGPAEGASEAREAVTAEEPAAPAAGESASATAEEPVAPVAEPSDEAAPHGDALLADPEAKPEAPPADEGPVEDTGADSFSTTEREAIADQPTEFFDQTPEPIELGELDLDLKDELDEPAATEDQPPTGEEAVEPATGEEAAPVDEATPVDEMRVVEETEPASEEMAVEPEQAPAEEAPAEEASAGEAEEVPVPAEAEAEDGEEGEDVLEETPEFLRDNPDDDELWFEQGEPKDFDF